MKIHFTSFFIYFSLVLFLNSCNSETLPENTEQILVSDSIETEEEEVISEIKSMESFIYEGYQVLDSTSADLNGDSFTDIILIMKQENEEELSENSEEEVKRPLLILTGDGNGSFTEDASNDKAVYCFSCGGMMGDPYSGLNVEGNFFTLTHYGGSAQRWARIITFEYNKDYKGWYLHKDGTESFHASSPEKVTNTQKRTMGVPFKDFNIYD
jgi:hypothetical protein